MNDVDMVFILVIQLARLPIVIIVSYVARDCFTRLNGIIANFNYCDSQTKYRIFVSLCTSYHGSCLWDLQHKLVDLCVLYNMSKGYQAPICVTEEYPV